MRSILISFASLVFMCALFLPEVAFGQGLTPLVQCDGVGADNLDRCGACHAIELVQRILNFLVYIASFFAVILIAYAGLLLVLTPTNEGYVSKAKGILTDTVIGIIIVLIAWLAIDTVMKNLFTGSELEVETRDDFGPWNRITCVEQPDLRNPNPGRGRPTPYGGTASTLSDGSVATRIERTNAYREELCRYARAEGVGAQCDHLQALMAIESNGDPNAQSGVGAVGLMQIMPYTARTLDPSVRGMSDSQLRERLKDPSYNMQLGTKLFARDYQFYGGDSTLVYAAYNGGRGANNSSRDCDGLLRWQCEWDNPEHTVPNTGYQETRNYVVNVRKVVDELQR